MTIHLEFIAPWQVAEKRMLCLVSGLVLVTLGVLPATSILLQDCLACRSRRLDRHRLIINNLDYFHYFLTRSSSATRPR
jgi:hypothetical protein